MPTLDRDKYPYGSPLAEYTKFKGYNKPQEIEAESEATTHDLLVAMLYSAETIWVELRAIRDLLERQS